MGMVQTVPESGTRGTWRERALQEVTVVVPTFRNVPYLAAAFESALDAPAAAVLVADDGCGVEEREVISRFEAAHPGRLRALISERQRGIAANLNEAIARVRTPYFVRLDCDDILYPGHVEEAYRFLEDRRDVALVTGSAVRIGASDYLEYRPNQLPAYRPDPDPVILRGIEAFRFGLRWDPNPSSSGTVYRTAAFRDVGCFNTKVPWGEDWEIWFRFARRWDLAYVNAPTALYRIHDGATTSRYAQDDRLCFGYDFMYRRAASLCPYPEMRREFRRLFARVARLYAGAALRQARRFRPNSIVCAGKALGALAAAGFGV